MKCKFCGAEVNERQIYNICPKCFKINLKEQDMEVDEAVEKMKELRSAIHALRNWPEDRAKADHFGIVRAECVALAGEAVVSYIVRETNQSIDRSVGITRNQSHG